MKCIYPSYCPYPGQALVCLKKSVWVNSVGLSTNSGPDAPNLVTVKDVRFSPEGVFLTLVGYDKKNGITGAIQAFNARAFLPVDLYHAELTNQLEKVLLSDCLNNRIL